MPTRIVTVQYTDDELITQCADVFRQCGKVLYDDWYARFMSYQGLMWAALDQQDRPIAALTTDLWSPRDVAEWNGRLPAGQQLSSDPPALHLCNAAVAPGERHRGVATQLIRHALFQSEYVDDGSRVDRCFAVSRVPLGGSRHCSYNLLARLGFRELAAAPSYYESAGPDSWLCPDDEGGPCRCAGHLMLWTRPDE